MMRTVEPAGAGTATWRALGTYVHLSTAYQAALEPARRIAIGLLAEVDRACSRFREDSDLVRANANAGSWTNVDPLLVQAITAAVDAAEQTDGLVDPTLGHSLVAVGYDRDLALIPAASADPAGIPLPARFGAWREILLDPQGAVRVPQGCAMDLGATAKAWAADLIANAVAGETGSTVVISLGGDLAVAGPGDGWPIAVQETIADPTGAEVVHLPYGGMATSSTASRRWIRGGVIRHHLLDPRTGESTQGSWRTVTATGATCLAANTASTAAIVLGDKAVGWLTTRDVPARLVDAHGRIVRTARWPEPEMMT